MTDTLDTVLLRIVPQCRGGFGYGLTVTIAKRATYRTFARPQRRTRSR